MPTDDDGRPAVAERTPEPNLNTNRELKTWKRERQAPYGPSVTTGLATRIRLPRASVPLKNA